MEKVTTAKRLVIVKLYLLGLSYDEILAKSGVSKGTVANVVTDLKAEMFPEATDVGEHTVLLRELSLDLKRSRLTPGQCVVGLTVLSRINDCGLEPADIERWPRGLNLRTHPDHSTLGHDNPHGVLHNVL